MTLKPYRKGLLPLSGDPITWGHLDLVQRASLQCDHLLIAVLGNPNKKGGYVFGSGERVGHLKRALEDFFPETDASVICSEEGMVDMFLTQGCDVVFRGVRDEQDREYEDQQLFYHEMVLPGITEKTVILEADPSLKYVQSTVARNFAVKHLDASKLVPMFVQARLWRRIHKQQIIGVTGEPGVGKTTLINATLEALRENNLPAHHIVLEDEVHHLLQRDRPGVRVLRELLKEKVPTGESLPKNTRNLFFGHLGREYRGELKGRSGVILVEYPYLAEDGLLHWVNNNVIVVTRPGCELTVPMRDMGGSWGAEEKLKVCLENAEKDKYGLVFKFEHEENDFKKGLGGVIVAKVRSGEM